ncbi:response regulator [Cognatishimia sp. F0-27]|uniref:response regulator n=1 Tax=Cognatishimia sp. F0-27 TaxID=2816855 RepID=UPI001D0C9659|nr:response regulator [Cognatishimia sp. F0-27]
MTSTTKPGATANAVLIVEDEVLVAQDLAFMVEDLGCSVLGPLHTLTDALATVAHTRPDFAILDVNLGDGQIFPLADVLLAQDVPFVFCSAHFEVFEVDARYPDAGLVQKPFNERMIRQAIESCLG